jgi:hypothetical protein
VDQLLVEEAFGVLVAEGDDRAILRYMLSPEILTKFREIPEAPGTRFRPYRTAGPNLAFDIDESGLLLDWVDGTTIDQLADVWMPVGDEEYRFEQLGDYLAAVAENFLPWTIGYVVNWYNAKRPEGTSPLPRRLAGFVRYGVGTRPALHLIRRGVRSRQLVIRVSAEYIASRSEASVRDWLAGLPINRWRRLFDASRAELAELIDFARLAGTTLLSDLLERGFASVAIRPSFVLEPGSLGRLRVTRYGQLDRPVFAIGSRTAGTFDAERHADVMAIVRSGLPVAVRYDPREGRDLVSIAI